jgi:hypothetical protein
MVHTLQQPQQSLVVTHYLIGKLMTAQLTFHTHVLHACTILYYCVCHQQMQRVAYGISADRDTERASAATATARATAAEATAADATARAAAATARATAAEAQRITDVQAVSCIVDQDAQHR